MVLEKLKDLLLAFSKRGADRAEIDELVRGIQRVLIQADVDVKLVAELADRIRKKALEEKLPAGITRREHVIKVVYDELVAFLGAKKAEAKVGRQKILLLGLFGAGKTTMTVKLARFFQKRGLKVGIVGADVWRPAAFEQLRQLAANNNIEVFGLPKEKDPVRIVKSGLQEMRQKDVVIVDSAGRSAFDDALRKEIVELNKIISPDEKLLVVSADIGQAAGKQAREFNAAVGLTGVIVTKMDSSAKGGGALSTCWAAGVPVKFIGVGEKADDLELYDPVRFVSRILGMGDIQALVEKAKTALEPKKAEEMLRGEFTLSDFYEQLQAMQKMGPLDKVLEMIPGFGGLTARLPKEMLPTQEQKMKRWKFMIDSMTKEERNRPELIDRSRIERIARGSGSKPEEVKELLKNYEAMRKILKKMKPSALKRGGLGKMFSGFKMPR